MIIRNRTTKMVKPSQLNSRGSSTPIGREEWRSSVKSNYMSNTDGRSYKSVTDKICEGVTDPEVLVEEVHERIINRHGKLSSFGP